MHSSRAAFSSLHTQQGFGCDNDDDDDDDVVVLTDVERGLRSAARLLGCIGAAWC
jgi:hypothetical protein